MEPMQVLLAAPLLPRLDALRERLESEGCRLLDLPADTDPVSAALEHRPDAVILDHLLPGLDGVRTCARLRLELPGEPLPVLLLVQGESAEHAARLAGATATAPWPCPDDTLHRALESLRRAGATPPAPKAFEAHRVRPFGGPTPDHSPTGPWEPFSPPDLGRFVQERFREQSGDRYEIRAGDHAVLLTFHRGEPTVEALEPEWVPIEPILAREAPLDPAILPRAREQARRAGIPLLAFLQADGWLSPPVAQALAREHDLRRLLTLAEQTEARYRRRSPSPLRSPARPLPVAALQWRLGEHGCLDATLSSEDREAFFHPTEALEDTLRLLDPQGDLAGLRLLVTAGGRVSDALELGGATAERLIPLLKSTGLLVLRPEPLHRTERNARIARADPGPWCTRLQTDHDILADADAWTLLGLDPGAEPGAIRQAARAALARHDPTSLPPGLPARHRRRARELYGFAVQASRILTHPGRRRIYDEVLLPPHSDRDRPVPLVLDDYAVLLAERGRRLLHHGQPLAAAALFALAITLEGPDPDILALLGWSRHLAAEDDPAAGRTELDHALALDPAHAHARRYRDRLLPRAEPT